MSAMISMGSGEPVLSIPISEKARKQAKAIKSVAGSVRYGHGTYDDLREGLANDERTAVWYREIGLSNDEAQVKALWDDTAAWDKRAKWLVDCQKTIQGDPRGNYHNVMIALRRDPRICDAFVYDDMLRKTVLTKRLAAGSVEERDARFHRPLQDSDIYALVELLQASGLESVSHNVVHQAVEVRSKELRYHPVRTYLDSLQWDGTERLDTWLTTYAGVVETPYTKAVGGKFIISMVARAYKPGCQADYMLILEGPQGLQKSSLCRVLAGKWFSDSLPDIRNGNKDLASHLSGKWLIEVAELAAATKSEQGALKAFITRRIEQFRPAYGRNEADHARQCVFIGTTNKATYLRDSTGGRRNWPVVVGSIELAKLEEDRDQLFAEAVHRFNAGENWWPDRDFEAEHIVPEQNARREEDVWTPIVAKFLQTKGRTTVAEILTECLHFDTDRMGQREQRRIGELLLMDLGWTYERTSVERWWEPPKQP